MGYSCYTYICFGVEMGDVVDETYKNDAESYCCNELYCLNGLNIEFEEVEDIIDYIEDLDIEVFKDSNWELNIIGRYVECDDEITYTEDEISWEINEAKRDIETKLNIKNPDVKMLIIKKWH